MSGNVVELRPAPEPTEPLRAYSASRVAEGPNTIAVHFNRPLTDGELRFFEEVCQRSACLMDGET